MTVNVGKGGSSCWLVSGVGIEPPLSVNECENVEAVHFTCMLVVYYFICVG